MNSITISFDGALRNNGKLKTNQKSSIGVFTESYDSSFSFGKIIEPRTNTIAEAVACTYALRTAKEIAKKFGEKAFTIHGDSNHIIGLFLRGQITKMKQQAEYMNTAVWTDLKTAYEEAKDVTSQIEFLWTSRRYNKEADELANAVLDDRPPNKGIISPKTNSLIDFSPLEEIISLLSTTRLPTIRTLPDNLATAWKTLVFSILSSYSTSTEKKIQTRKLFIILPHLLSLPQKSIKSNQHFKDTRDHIALLQDPRYMSEQLVLLRETLIQKQQNHTTNQERNPIDEEKRIQTLCSRGLFHQCLKTDSIFPSPHTEENKKKLSDLFPQAELPTPLPEQQATIFTFAECLSAFYKLKRGKCPGLSGWTRELLTPIFRDPPSIIQQILSSIFSDFSNVTITEVEKIFFLSGVLSPLSYKQAPTKIRPIIILDSLFKLAWHVVLSTVNDPNLLTSSHTFSRRGSCQLSLFTVQAALNAGETVISLDADNAYNTICRKAALTYISSHTNFYFKCFPLLNLFYTRKSTANWFVNGIPVLSIPITNGTRQGCVSGMWFYTIATLQLNLKYKEFITQTADDIYIVKEALNKVEEIAKDFREIGQNLLGKKLKVIGNIEKQHLPPCISHASIYPSTAAILGGIVSSPTSNAEEEKPFLKDILKKIENKFSQITLLPTSLQNKFLILHAISLDFLFYTECIFTSNRREFFEKIDEIQETTFAQIMNIQDFSSFHHVQLFSSIEDGGLGIFPYFHTHSSIQNKAAQRSLSYIRRFFPTAHFSQEEEEATQFPSLKTLWTANFRDKFAPIATHKQHMRAAAFSPTSFSSWLTQWPKNSIHTLSDEDFSFAILFRLKHLPITATYCKEKEQCVTSFCETKFEFTQHMLSCPRCAGLTNHTRHEAVNNMLHKTLSYHSISHSINPKKLPIPGKTRGGADLLLFETTCSSTIYAIDVAIAKEKKDNESNDRSALIFARKLKHYEEYCLQTGQVAFPFVMSIYGVIFKKSLTLLKKALKNCLSSPFLLPDLISNVQFALIRGLRVGMMRTWARKQQDEDPAEYQAQQEDSDAD